MNVAQYPLSSSAKDWMQLHRYLAPFDILRAMDWIPTNNNDRLVNVSDFAVAHEDWSYKGEAWDKFKGVPISAIIQLANTLGASVWITIPHLLTDEAIKWLVTKLMTECALPPRIEWSNEVWNDQFTQNEHAFQMAVQLQLGSEEEGRRSMAIRYQAERTKVIRQIIDDIDPNGAILVACGQFFAPETTRLLLSLLTGVVDEIGVAPYFGAKNRGFHGNVSAVHENAINEIETIIPAMIRTHVSLCQSADTKLIAYEGGDHHSARYGIVGGSRATEEQFQTEKRTFYEYNRSSLCGEATYKLWSTWKDLSGTPFSPYALVSTYQHPNDTLASHFYGHIDKRGDDWQELPKYYAAVSCL